VAYQTTPVEPPAQQLSNNNERGIIMTVSIFNKKRVDKSSDFDFKSILSKLEKLESELNSTQKSIADVNVTYHSICQKPCKIILGVFISMNEKKSVSNEVYHDSQLVYLWKLYHKDSEDVEEKGVTAKEVR
jgi:hypothetical protein